MARTLTCWRIVEVKTGQYRSLFHGNNGSRVIPQSEWVEATKRPARDGGGQARDIYLSGYQVLLRREDAEAYFGRFRHTENRIIVQRNARGLRSKHSDSAVWLADEIFILGGQA